MRIENWELSIGQIALRLVSSLIVADNRVERSSAFAHRSGPTDRERAAGEQLSIQGSDGLFGHQVFFQFDKPESARPASCMIMNNFDSARLEALRAEPFGQSVFCFCERDVTNKQSLQNSPPAIISFEYAKGRACGIERCPTQCRTHDDQRIFRERSDLKFGKMRDVSFAAMC